MQSPEVPHAWSVLGLIQSLRLRYTVFYWFDMIGTIFYGFLLFHYIQAYQGVLNDLQCQMLSIPHGCLPISRDFLMVSVISVNAWFMECLLLKLNWSLYIHEFHSA